MPKYYKYIPFGRSNSKRRKWTMDIFRNNRLYLGHFNDLNDPMEAMFNANHLTNQHIKQIQSLKPNILIGCLTQTYTDILMWTHYADNHLGCCIEFEINRIDGDYIKPMNYSTQIEAPQHSNILNESVNILTNKLQPWEHEQEIRYLRQIDRNDDDSHYVYINITTVYLGVKLSEKSANYYQKLITQISPSITVRQIRTEELTWWDGKRNKIVLV